MNEKLVRAIAEYVPLVAGFIFLVNKQVIAGSASLALYVPINQFNRRPEIAEIRKNIPAKNNDADVNRLVAEIEQLLQTTRPEYKPLYNRRESHEVLKYALPAAKLLMIRKIDMTIFWPLSLNLIGFI